MQMWFAGQTVTAAGLNRMLPLVAYKTSTTSRAATTTAADDTELVITIPSDALVAYSIEVFLSVTGPTLGTGDIKAGLTYTGSVAQGTWMGQGTDTTTTQDARFFGRSIDTTTQTQQFGVNGGNFSVVQMNGLITPSSAGVLSVRWAQNTSNATATNVRLGSWIKLTRFDP